MSRNDQFSSNRRDHPITNVRIQSLMHMGAEDSSATLEEVQGDHEFAREDTQPGLTFESEVRLPSMEGDSAAEFYTQQEDVALGAWLLTTRSRRMVFQSLDAVEEPVVQEGIRPWCEWLERVDARAPVRALWRNEQHVWCVVQTPSFVTVQCHPAMRMGMLISHLRKMA